MAVQPLSPATDRRLGEPLPHQLSNQTRAHPCAINLCRLYHAILSGYAVLASVSGRYPPHKGRLLTRYSPVRHWSAPKGFTVRLECVMHAASVNPEPGSNSRNLGILTSRRREDKINSEPWLLFYFFRVVFSFRIVETFFAQSHTFVFLLLHTYLLLFNFQGPLPSPYSQRPCHYITIPRACQYPFQSFFNFF